MALKKRILPGLLLAVAPALACAETPAAGVPPLQVSVTTDASAPDGALRAVSRVEVQPQVSPNVDARLAVTLAAGEGRDQTPSWAGVSSLSPLTWNRAGVSLQAAWTGLPGAKLQLEAGHEFRNQTFLGPATLDSRPVSRDEVQSVGLKAQAQLAPALSLTLGAGGGADYGTVDLVSDGSVMRRVALRDERGEVSSQVAWQVTPTLSLQVADKLETRSLSWGQAGVLEDHSNRQPRATAVLKPLPGAEWSLSVEHATSPLQPSKFAALAVAAEAAQLPAASGQRLRPDETWQVRAVLSHKFRKTGALKVAVTRADLKSSTELVEIAPGVQAPGSVAGGERRQLDVTLNVPLDLIGLPGLSLQSSGQLRRSEIPDPITGAMRPPSGETAYEARLGLVADLPHEHMRLGLQGQASGPQTVYSLTQVDAVTVGPSVGAFIEYRPADLIFRLQLDDLTGADRRYASALYGRGRDNAATAETDREVSGGAGVTLSIRRAF